MDTPQLVEDLDQDAEHGSGSVGQAVVHETEDGELVLRKESLDGLREEEKEFIEDPKQYGNGIETSLQSAAVRAGEFLELCDEFVQKILNGKVEKTKNSKDEMNCVCVRIMFLIIHSIQCKGEQKKVSLPQLIQS